MFIQLVIAKFTTMRILRAARFLGLASLTAVLFGYTLSAFATDYPVGVTGFPPYYYSFSPSTLSINTGDSVTWSGLGGGIHTSSSDDALWDSLGSPNDSYSFVFNTAGTYSYHCDIHYYYGMVGSVTVNAAVAPNSPPTISIDSPASGKVFAAPANVTIQTTPADSDGSVTNVQFLLGSTVLTNLNAGPFSMTVSNLTAADYVISAIVSDDQGATATNSTTVHVINPKQAMMTSPMLASVGNFQFSYSTDVGLGYVVEVSTNLMAWKPIATNSPATVNPSVFIDPNATPAGAYYRVSRLPNP